MFLSICRADLWLRMDLIWSRNETRNTSFLFKTCILEFRNMLYFVQYSGRVTEPVTLIHLMCDIQQHSQCSVLRGTPNSHNGGGAEHAPVTISDSPILQAYIISIAPC